MQFGLEKCVKVTFKKGSLVKFKNIIRCINTKITMLEHNKTYEANGINHSINKEKIKKEFSRRIRAILRTEVNAKNKVIAINSLAIPVMTYSLNIINWTQLK